MNQAEEDALVNEIFDKSWRTEPGAQTSLFNMAESIRLAIRAAVAAERERAAKVCEKNSEEAIAQQSGPTDDLTNIMLRHHASQAYSCAAAIRRGE